jgi:superfamily II DNA or RNA helicase
MVESPTGSGKTVMGLAIARYMQTKFGFSIGWVAMRRNLLAQAQQENQRWNFGVDLTTISMFDRAPPVVDMLIIDEAQHDAAMSMANLHCAIRPKKVLGLTATPFRTDRIKLCFDQVIRDAGIHQLIQDGYLSRYHHFTIPEYTPESVADFLVQDPKRWDKSLVFFHRQEQCVACCEKLAAAGMTAEVVTSKTDRERQLADFAEHRIDVLINMSILTEGFDCPALKTVFCRPSGRGCTIQMAGRVFRKHPELPRKQIVQCKKTRHPFVRTAMADEQYVWADGSWQALMLNREIAAISDRARNAIARAPVALPKLVAAHRPRPLPWRSEA